MPPAPGVTMSVATGPMLHGNVPVALRVGQNVQPMCYRLVWDGSCATVPAVIALPCFAG